jgi:hypothetical protein
MVNEYRGVGGMRIGRAKLNGRKPVPVPLCSPRIPSDHSEKPATKCLSCGAERKNLKQKTRWTVVPHISPHMQLGLASNVCLKKTFVFSGRLSYSAVNITISLQAYINAYLCPLLNV